MQGPGQPPQPAQPGQPGQAVFDPDQFKQDILSAVQQELNNFAQNFQTGQPALPPGIPQYGPQPMYGQQPVYGQQPLYGHVVNALPPMQGGLGQYQQQQIPPFFQPQQPGQQFGLMPVQPQLPYNPQGQQPTIEQLMQAIMYLLQRQEQMYMQMQQMAQGHLPMLPGGQSTTSATVAPPFPHAGDRVDQYRWLMDFGLTCNYDGTARAQVTHRDIANRRKHLDQLEWGLSWSEYWELVGDKYHGVIFQKY